MADQLEPSPLLASDAERERSILWLRDAVVEGRLTLEEFSDRVEHAQKARTDQELSALSADLPPRTPVVAGAASSTQYKARFSHLQRRGSWELPARSQWRSIFGTIDIDLRQASLASSEIELDIYSLFGTVTIVIPAGIAIELEGGGAFASQKITPPAWPPPPGAPRIRIRASGPGGTLYVRSEPR